MLGVNAAVVHFYPRSPCGERHLATVDIEVIGGISIHALLAESDPRRLATVDSAQVFLSTLSLRRATIIFRCVCQGLKYFYPRSPCGERPPRAGHCRGCDGISIHALLAESDAGRQPVLVQIVEFLSTLSLRRATERECAAGRRLAISIHALLAESDPADGRQ